MPAKKPNFAIGQLCIKHGANRYLFTPTFKNISNIAEPKDLVSIFNIMNDKDTDIVAACGFSNDILTACCDDELPDGLLWSLASSWDGKRTIMREGLVSLSAQILIASDLLFMGMIGKPPTTRSKSTSKEVSEFNCSEFVSIAVAQLGVTPSAAWDMTMVEFQESMKIKHPELFKPKDLPTKSELDKLSKWADEATERLNNKRGVKSA